MNSAELSNKILAYLNGFPSGLTFAQIYDGVKPDLHPNLAFCRTAAGAVYEMVCDGLICCNDLFAEASNGATREKQVLYKITHLGKMRLYGLIVKESSTTSILDSRSECSLYQALNTGDGGRQVSPITGLSNEQHKRTSGYAIPPQERGIDDSQILDVADQGRGIAPFTESITVGNGGGATAPALSSPPSTIDSLMSTVNRLAVANRELCDCGRSVTKVCACGKEVCSVHWYDADGNHTLDATNGMCGDCVSAIELQTWGESRCGIAGRQF